MAKALQSLSFWIMMISVHVMSLVLAQDRDHFVVYDFSQADTELQHDGMATTLDGRLQLTNNSTQMTGNAFRKVPINLTSSSTYFSTEFVFAILPLQSTAYCQGMAFVVSHIKDLSFTCLVKFNQTKRAISNGDDVCRTCEICDAMATLKPSEHCLCQFTSRTTISESDRATGTVERHYIFGFEN
ncbi:unnamed protein product [Arabis nemorensis]|uniref:Legume lectin domain-containing protein n=1 Tax=Arabis nemorensis TaxID=586526 RepID=A0A565CQR3_9BRAS|nr:unnamed protein product [Arabis nemorensis]